MIDLHVHKLQYLISSLAMIETALSVTLWEKSNGPKQLQMYGAEGDMAQQFDLHIEMLESLELVDCASVLRRAKTSYLNQGKPGYSNEQLEELLRAVRHQMYDGLKRPQFIVLNGAEKALYEQAAPLFGQEVATQFPSLKSEISEVGKCFALGRFTASAFHSIRSLEAAIRAMSRCLGIPDPTKGADRSWGAMLRTMGEEMQKRWPSAASRFSGDGKLFEELHGALSAIQNPYRNATAHLDSDYTADQARHLMELTKGLLQRVAARMNESGDQRA
jgi:hypothetical protein